MGHKKKPAFRFAHVLVVFSLTLVCMLRSVWTVSNIRSVTMLRYTRCNTVILMAATAWLMSFSSCIVCGVINHAVAAIKITMLHRVHLNMIRRGQLCIGAGGNHFQHLLWWYILSAFGYCITFCIYATLRTRDTFKYERYKQWTQSNTILLTESTFGGNP
jgi:hypothetical protein